MTTREEVRAELIRSRGFIRGAETQLTKALDALDALDVVEPPPPPPPPPPSGNEVRWSGSLTDPLVQIEGPTTHLHDIDGRPLGFPDRALQIRAAQSAWGHVKFPDVFPAPAPGVRWWMEYLTMVEAGIHTRQHPFCLTPVGTIAMVFQRFSPADGGWSFALGMPGGPQFPWNAYRAGAPLVIPFGSVVRVRHEWEWVTATSYRLVPRVSELDGTPLADEFRHSNGAGQMAAWFAAGNAVTPPNVAGMRTPSFGQGDSQTGSDASYYAADARFGWSA